MIYTAIVFNEAFTSQNTRNRLGIKVDPKKRIVKIRLRLPGKGDHGIGGNSSASYSWGNDFYEDVKRDIEGLGYSVRKEKVGEEGRMELYEFVVESEGKPIARYGILEREKLDRDSLLRFSLGTYLIPHSGDIGFDIEDENQFPNLLNGLIQNPNGVVGQRYRNFLRASRKGVESTIRLITGLNDP